MISPRILSFFVGRKYEYTLSHFYMENLVGNWKGVVGERGWYFLVAGGASGTSGGK
jgi:hypothetical protein